MRVVHFFSSFVIAFVRVYDIRVLLQRGEDLTFFACFWILQGLVIFYFATLGLCHVAPKEILFYRSLVVLGHLLLGLAGQDRFVVVPLVVGIRYCIKRLRLDSDVVSSDDELGRVVNVRINVLGQRRG